MNTLSKTRQSRSRLTPLLWWTWLLLLAAWTIGCAARPMRHNSSYPKSVAPPEPAPAPASPAKEPALFEDDRLGLSVASQEDAEYEAESGAVPPSPVAKPKLASRAGESTASPANGKPRPPRSASDSVSIQQVLIYTADFTVAVYQVDKSMDRLEKMARSLGGFLAKRTSDRIVIRVPADRFQEAVEQTTSLGDVLSRNIQVQDVTEEVTDLLLRLRNARQVRDRIAALLEQSKSVKDSLRIERELARITEQIERMEGRLKLLRSKARYSTITVDFREITPPDMKRRHSFRLPFPWLDRLGLGRLLDL